MAKEEQQGINALGAQAAYNLANVTKTKPQYGAITPKWLTKLLEFKGLETGIYRVNKVVEGDTPLRCALQSDKKIRYYPGRLCGIRDRAERVPAEFHLYDYQCEYDN